MPGPALKPYMGYAGEPEEGAVLILARSSREARRLGYPTVAGWMDCTWLEMRAPLIRNHTDYALTLADQDKLAAGVPHVIESPAACERCELWGTPMESGVCITCLELENGNG